jgi:hypothetical protein
VRRSALVALAGAAALAGTGCGDDASGPSGADGTIEASFTGVPESTTYLGHLELWISFAATRTGGALRHSTNASAGKFKIMNGAIVGLDYQPMTFAVDTEDPDVPLGNDGQVLWQLAVDAFVSIEPDGDLDPSEPNAVLLGGAFLNGAATLGVDHGDGLDDDFAGVAGTFQLATPSTSANADSLEGCWFATPGSTPAASLTLPALSVNDAVPQSRWIYEAWISLPSAGLASLGRFKTPLLPDGDLDGPLSGVPPTDGPGFAFPGSDFPYGSAGIDLSTGSVLVTLEPVDDNDPNAPFFLELLGGPVPSPVATGVSYPLASQTAATFPGGLVTIPPGE